MITHNKVVFYSDHACSYVRIVYLPPKSLSLVGAGVSVVDGSSLAADAGSHISTAFLW